MNALCCAPPWTLFTEVHVRFDRREPNGTAVDETEVLLHLAMPRFDSPSPCVPADNISTGSIRCSHDSRMRTSDCLPAVS